MNGLLQPEASAIEKKEHSTLEYVRENPYQLELRKDSLKKWPLIWNLKSELTGQKEVDWKIANQAERISHIILSSLQRQHMACTGNCCYQS